MEIFLAGMRSVRSIEKEVPMVQCEFNLDIKNPFTVQRRSERRDNLYSNFLEISHMFVWPTFLDVGHDF